MIALLATATLALWAVTYGLSWLVWAMASDAERAEIFGTDAKRPPLAPWNWRA